VKFDALSDRHRANVIPTIASSSPIIAYWMTWSLTSLQQRLFKTRGRLIRHARYFTLQLAESYLTRPLFRQIVARIERLAWPPT